MSHRVRRHARPTAGFWWGATIWPSLIAGALTWVAGCGADSAPDPTGPSHLIGGDTSAQTVGAPDLPAATPLDAAQPADDAYEETGALADFAPSGETRPDDTGPDDTAPEPTDGDAHDVGPDPDDGEASDAGTEPPTPPGATRYPGGELFSPMPASVTEHLLSIRAAGPGLADDVFMKVGASSTVSDNNLSCFAGSSVDLGEWDALQPTLDWHLAADAAGSTPFDRKTKAAKVGMSAGWAIGSSGGGASPIALEIADIAPATALVHYGTNDMQLGITYESAIWKFGDNLLTLADTLTEQGIIAVLFSIMPRKDAVAANWWVQTYNAVIRGVAQARQLPFVDIHLATQPLPGFGLAGDGIHLNSWSGGACVLTPEASVKGYNVRNRVSLQLLDRLRAVLVGEWSPEPAVPQLGDGSPEDPFVIDALPFVDLRDTASSPNSNFAFYPGCSAPQDESGPEYLYRLDLTETTRLRFLVFDRGSVDIDVHLLDESASGEGCVERDHQIIQRTLGAGTWYLSLDTFVSAGAPKAGEYLLVVLECHPDDPECDG